MFKITHGEALEIESQIRQLFSCGRSGVSGLADADHFESYPLDAAVMVVSYIYANGLQEKELQYEDFLGKYFTIFNYPNEYDAEKEVHNYINDLSDIVKKYLRSSK